MEYTLQLLKHGNLSGLIKDLRNRNIIDDEILTTFVYDTDVETKYAKDLEKLVFEAGEDFNNHFKVRIIDKERQKIYVEPFRAYNNFKQLILFHEMQSKVLISTIHAERAVLKYLSTLELEFKKPFWAFTEKEVRKTIDRMARDGFTPHTITTKISSIIRSEKAAKAIARDIHVLSNKNYSSLRTNSWYNEVHKPTKEQSVGSRRGNVKKFFTRGSFVDEVLAKGSPENTVVALLAFRGVKFPARKDQNDNEIGNIRVRDFTGNVLTIHGAYERQIRFNDDEMKYIRKLFEGVTEDDYLLRPSVRNRRGRTNGPLKRWTLSEKRLKPAAEEAGLGKKDLDYYKLRLNGEAVYLNSRIIQKYDDIHIERNEFILVAIETFEQYGVAKKGELTPGDFASGTNRDRLVKLMQLRAQYLKSAVR